jgi:hypothetical protein
MFYLVILFLRFVYVFGNLLTLNPVDATIDL